MRLQDALPPARPIADVLPNLTDHARALGVDPTVTRPRSVFGTRRLAREVVATQAESPTVVDFSGVEVVTTPFVDELRRAWPAATATGMNEEVAAVWVLLEERS